MKTLTAPEKNVASPTLHARTQSRGTTAKPKVVVRARVVSYPQVQRRKKVNRFERVAAKVILFGVVMAASYGASSITGQVMVEKSRRDEIQALARTRTAVHMETALKGHLQDLVNPQVIANWAESHQFVTGAEPKTTDAAKKPASTMVARND
ncbi:MAG TPA: hypothetical protein VG944_07480 [Fimbriimonas sp.]|nr:hypothetical protein [Fimbriimonas sp.]